MNKEHVFIEPLVVTKYQAEKMLGSPQMLKRLIAARWVIVVRKGSRGRATLIVESLKKAYQH